MKYLVVYPNYEGQTEEKEIFTDAASATEYIEGILRAGTAKDDQVKLYEIQAVNIKVERVPVVKISEENGDPSFAAASIVPEITTEEEVAEEEVAEEEVAEEEVAEEEVGETSGDPAEETEEELAPDGADVEVFTFES